MAFSIWQVLVVVCSFRLRVYRTAKCLCCPLHLSRGPLYLVYDLAFLFFIRIIFVILIHGQQFLFSCITSRNYFLWFLWRFSTGPRHCRIYSENQCITVGPKVMRAFSQDCFLKPGLDHSVCEIIELHHSLSHHLFLWFLSESSWILCCSLWMSTSSVGGWTLMQIL